MNRSYPAYLSFPFRIGADGRTAGPADLDAHVRDELVQLILTTVGERAFLPELGTNVRRLVFASTDETTKGVTRAMIADALATWLGTRVTLEELTVTADAGEIDVLLRYRPIGSRVSKVVQFRRTGV